MDDDALVLCVGSLVTLGALGMIGAVTIRGRAGRVGGRPRWPSDTRDGDDSRRGQGSTRYTGGTAGIGVDLSLGLRVPDYLRSHCARDPLPRDHQRHAVRYPRRAGECLERLMYGGPGAHQPSIPVWDRTWLYAPPSREDL
jgi:hypothetical protein